MGHNRPVAQIPQCVSPISHNAPVCNRNVHIPVTKWCTVGYFYNALWDMWVGSIGWRVVFTFRYFTVSCYNVYMDLKMSSLCKHSLNLGGSGFPIYPLAGHMMASCQQAPWHQLLQKYFLPVMETPPPTEPDINQRSWENLADFLKILFRCFFEDLINMG